MEILNVIGSVCSILSLLISLFVLNKVIKIEKSIKIKGDKNIVGGRDVNVKG